MLAVFEKAHAPTDDEREALLRDLYTLRGWTGGDVLRRIEIIDRAMAALSRSDVPEPPTEPTCEHGTMLTYLCDDCADAVETEPQGEPSDAQVLAAMEAYAEYREPDGPGDAMRAALRAAAEVGR
jgi:hypothetical protein